MIQFASKMAYAAPAFGNYNKSAAPLAQRVRFGEEDKEKKFSDADTTWKSPFAQGVAANTPGAVMSFITALMTSKVNNAIDTMKLLPKFYFVYDKQLPDGRRFVVYSQIKAYKELKDQIEKKKHPTFQTIEQAVLGGALPTLSFMKLSKVTNDTPQNWGPLVNEQHLNPIIGNLDEYIVGGEYPSTYNGLRMALLAPIQTVVSNNDVTPKEMNNVENIIYGKFGLSENTIESVNRIAQAQVGGHADRVANHQQFQTDIYDQWQQMWVGLFKVLNKIGPLLRSGADGAHSWLGQLRASSQQLVGAAADTSTKAVELGGNLIEAGQATVQTGTTAVTDVKDGNKYVRLGLIGGIPIAILLLFYNGCFKNDDTSTSGKKPAKTEKSSNKPAPKEEAAPISGSKTEEYIINGGEGPITVAKKFKLTQKEFERLNPDVNLNVLKKGDVIQVKVSD